MSKSGFGLEDGHAAAKELIHRVQSVRFADRRAPPSEAGFSFGDSNMKPAAQQVIANVGFERLSFPG